jgi:Family of unknown function (DUF6600)/FecR protein
VGHIMKFSLAPQAKTTVQFLLLMAGKSISDHAQPFLEQARLHRCRIEVPPTRVPGHGRLVMKTRTSVWITLVGVSLAMMPFATLSRAQDDTATPDGYSHVRIVRLSFVEGTVTVQKPDLADWSTAPINTPIEEGFKLSTSQESFAEVEFENTSTARLGQLTLLNFDQLVMSPNGAKVNRMTLEQGYGTFTVNPEDMEAFEVKALDATINLAAGATTQFRVDIDGGAVRVEVFKGAAQVSSPEGQQTLTKNLVVEIRPGAEQAFNVSQGIVKDAWDQWVSDRNDQVTMVRNSPTPSIYTAGNSNSYYGWNDLSNYGDWNYFPGYGYGWAPYMGMGWSPYTTGRWCWYPGMGYTWISSEPWGWLPYHYGGWTYQAGFGWTWFPGTLAFWSPGNVNWSQGSGWVGWTPRPPRGRVGSTACAYGENCGRIIVRPDTLRNGLPITRANLLNPDMTGGNAVAKPDILPNRTGRLPGAPFSSTFVGRANGGHGQQTSGGGVVTRGNNSVVMGESPGVRRSAGRPAVTVVGSRGVAGGESGVAFDSATGRFVNTNSSRPEAPSATSSNQGAPSLNRSEGGTTLAPARGQASPAAPRQESPWAAGGTATPGRVAPHSQAPATRPTTPTSSGGRIWGGSNSNSRPQGSGGGNNGGGFGGGGGRSSPFGSSSGGPTSSGGGGGGGGGSPRGGGGTPRGGGGPRK